MMQTKMISSSAVSTFFTLRFFAAAAGASWPVSEAAFWDSSFAVETISSASVVSNKAVLFSLFSSILLSPFSIDLDLYLNAEIIVAKRLDTFCLFAGILKVNFCAA